METNHERMDGSKLRSRSRLAIMIVASGLLFAAGISATAQADGYSATQVGSQTEFQWPASDGTSTYYLSICKSDCQGSNLVEDMLPVQGTSVSLYLDNGSYNWWIFPNGGEWSPE